MSFKILADSSHDMNEEISKAINVDIVPFKLYIDEEEIVDGEDIKILEFLDKMMASAVLPRTACPSPNDFLERIEADTDTFIVTISSELSGTYSSAILAKNLYLEEYPEHNIHVFDSKAASVGETLIGMKIRELEKKGLNFEAVVEQVEKYIGECRTFFISESLNNLMKNGRIPSWKGKMAMALKILPIMGADSDGKIQAYAKARGAARAIDKMIEMIGQTSSDFSERILAISHVNNLERAEKIAAKAQEHFNFKEIVILQTKGLSSLYCDNRGIILAF